MIEWEKISIDNGRYYKIIGDLGYAKIIIIGPNQDGEYWWNVKMDEKGHSPSIEDAMHEALKLLKVENK